MIRILFNRKNRILTAVLKDKKNLAKILQVRNAIVPMDKHLADTSEMRQFMNNIMTEIGLASRRVITLSIPELQSLLAAFHKNCVYFITPNANPQLATTITAAFLEANQPEQDEEDDLDNAMDVD